MYEYMVSLFVDIVDVVIILLKKGRYNCYISTVNDQLMSLATIEMVVKIATIVPARTLRPYI